MQLAACIGERLELRLLERLVGANDHEWTVDLIDRLLRSKLLIKKKNQHNHQMLAFAHPMCRLALVREMSPELRVKTHEAIAEALADFDDASPRELLTTYFRLDAILKVQKQP